MAPGLDKLRHIVVLMLENRSFDHMLGSLGAVDPRIDGVTAGLSNPDTKGAMVPAQLRSICRSLAATPARAASPTCRAL